MKIYLEKVIFVNRAPFDKLALDFNENEIVVLSSVNGRGKTTILSHIVDAFYEIAKPYFPDEFVGKEHAFYRVLSPIHNLVPNQPAFVYCRFKTSEETVDYVEISNGCTEEQYNEAIKIENKIPFKEIKPTLDVFNSAKITSPTFGKEKTKELFSNNILTYFPSYRYEQPGYLNIPYEVKLDFKKQSGFSGRLKNPIEVISDLPQLANWIMDVILDNQYLNVRTEDIKETLKTIKFEHEITPEQLPSLMNSIIQINILQKSEMQKNLNSILTNTLISKNRSDLRFGVGPRGWGSARIQIVSSQTGEPIYPTIFNLSSGEASMLCLFGELLRQADNIRNNIQLSEITGIVLIDEIDKHLHIKLQKEALPELLNLFPNIQFIVSSHSPFLSMGLAEEAQERSKIIDLDNNAGISKDPATSELYVDVYNMMLGENERFMEMYQSISNQITPTKKIQIVTEGKNTEHIKKAIEILNNSLISEIQIISGSEDKSGNQQLKNAFDIMSKGRYMGKFLFVWDCDSSSIADKVVETDNFKKFCFEKNVENTKARDKANKAIGIENLYPDSLFTEEVYDTKGIKADYGGVVTIKEFNKSKFLEKIKQDNTKSIFEKYQPLISKIKEIINLITEQL